MLFEAGLSTAIPRSRPPVPDHSIPDVEDDASEGNRPGVNSRSQDGETNLRIVMHHKCRGKKADGTACGAVCSFPWHFWTCCGQALVRGKGQVVPWRWEY